jgi:hypothetical protein
MLLNQKSAQKELKRMSEVFSKKGAQAAAAAAIRLSYSVATCT